MKLQPKRLLQTLGGKVLAAVLVVTTGFGAAAAAGADMPMLPTATSDASHEVVGREASGDEPAEEQVDQDELVDQSGDEPGVEQVDLSGEPEGAPTDESGAPNERSVANDDGEPSHGDVVSAFTQSTELSGCEKGQATAAVARGDVDPAADDIDAELAPYLEGCGDVEDVDESEEPEESVAGDDWKVLRDEGRGDADVARQAFVAACGDDEAPDTEVVEDAETTEADEPLIDECRALHDAAKQAHDDWKAAWHTARDAAKGGPDRTDVEAADDEAAVDGAADVAPSNPGPPDHAQGKAKDGTESKSAGKGNNAGGNGRGNGKP